MKKPPNFPRLRAVYALRKLSTALGSDVLANGNVAERFDIPVSRPVQLSKDAVIAQPILFKAFRQAMSGETISPLVDQEGKTLAAEVSMDAQGGGLVKIDGKGFRFENAALLSADAAKREEQLQHIIARHTLGKDAAESLRAEIAKPEFSDEKFLAAVEVLMTSQESFLASLSPKIKTRQIALGDVLPEQNSYWHQLTAPVRTSKSLTEFISNELLTQRQFLLAREPRKAMRAIALSFCAPGLVPLELLRTLNADAVLLMLEEATQFVDHFGLVGAFEICGDWLQRDSRFGPVGEKLLDRLFANEQSLKDRCWLYGAGFVLATTRLHQHQELRRIPAFWRRLTVGAHASLIVRAFASSSIDPHSLFKWAMGVSGKAYYCSICLDSVDEPRWRPDWLTPDMLIPDAFGRVDAVVKRLPEGVTNEQWTNRIEAARKLMGDNDAILATYPAIGESGTRPQPALQNMGELAGLYQALIDNPTVDNFLTAGPLFFSFGIPAECMTPAATVIAQLRQGPMKWDDGKIQAVAMLAIYLAMQLKDRTLADSVADFLIQNASTLAAERQATEILFRLIECSAADPYRQNGQKVLARRLETLAFVAPADHLPDIYDSLRVLQKLDMELAQLLGKAVAAARMGTEAA
jgi:hypothetical protein